MALSDKNIVITPNVGQAADPRIVFSGASSTLGPQNITLSVYPTSNGTLSFEGTAGQLLSITNSLSGTIFSVNDVSGIPSIEVLDTGLIRLAPFNGAVLVNLDTWDGTSKMQVNGTVTVSNLIEEVGVSIPVNPGGGGGSIEGLFAFGISENVTAAGSTQSTATEITLPISNVTVVAANTGVRLPVAVPGYRIIIRNGGANSLRVYPATSAQINALGANAFLSLETGATIEFISMSTSQWYTVNATFA
jgi:hypothetical protein